MRKTGIDIKCKICGRFFKTIPFFIKRKQGIVCSAGCRGKLQSKTRTIKRIKCFCLECKKEFYVPRCQIKQGGGKYCSRYCFFAWRTKHYSGNNNPLFGRRIKRTIIKCEICNKQFEERNCYMKRRKNHFCSNKCYGIWRSQNIVGNKVHNWQGGISSSPYGEEFQKKLKKQIRERDRFICRECGYSEKKLERNLSIHHIDYNKKNNDPNNLISLCGSCHAQTNFNRTNWIEYYANKLREV